MKSAFGSLILMLMMSTLFPLISFIIFLEKMILRSSSLFGKLALFLTRRAIMINLFVFNNFHPKSQMKMPTTIKTKKGEKNDSIWN